MMYMWGRYMYTPWVGIGEMERIWLLHFRDGVTHTWALPCPRRPARQHEQQEPRLGAVLLGG